MSMLRVRFVLLILFLHLPIQPAQAFPGKASQLLYVVAISITTFLMMRELPTIEHGPLSGSMPPQGKPSRRQRKKMYRSTSDTSFNRKPKLPPPCLHPVVGSS